MVLLPPSRPGGPARRFAVAPGKVFGLLFVTFVAGAVVAGAGLFAVLDGRRADAVADRDALRTKYESLSAKFEELEAKTAVGQGSAAAGAAAPDVGDGEPTSAQLRITPPTDAETALRIAVVRSSEPVRMVGEGLIVVQSASKAIPMPGGELLARASGKGVFIEGVGTLPSGTTIKNRLGPTKVGDREYPGTIELHNDGSGLLLINELELEKYLLGVVAAEVPAGWPMETKKAQAVVARTYALMQRSESDGPYHLEATIADQVYVGTAVDATTRAAVTATYGEVLLEDGLLVSAWFHSACGGTTEAPADVWPERAAHGNQIVECGFCEDSPYERWTVDLQPGEITKALKGAGHKTVRSVTGLHIQERTGSERVRELRIDTNAGPISMSGQEFRALVGYMRLKSASFSVEVAGNLFRVSGTGFGHGVGMCQHGARGMDRKGHEYREILTRFFPQSNVAKIY
ncbi:MAG: SpoIID/LytB domain-containing protein [Deltaproteobacteria bacterium]|nr:SpoIID/LytB domain-containing protein [Deltaproteobacteria bacterium]